jgi:lysozyme family protein
MNARQIIDDIIRREGGAVDHPSDRGGQTKYGITKATLSEYRGRQVSGVELFALTEQEAREIYQKNLSLSR